MLGVITGVLAFIVLIIAWLLRRANSGRDDDTHGVITETMVKEKLEQINLDLEQDPAPGSRSGRS
jgi:pilus assembly protein FimV